MRARLERFFPSSVAMKAYSIGGVRLALSGKTLQTSCPEWGQASGTAMCPDLGVYARDAVIHD
jgi:hypothetical protein